MSRNVWIFITCILIGTACQTPKTENSIGKGSQDVLLSWNEGGAKQSILSFVKAVTDSTSTSFVPTSERIAVFDNDGTLWAEQPFYAQVFFAVDRINALASENPEWKDKQPFKAALEGDMPTMLSGGTGAIVQLVLASHAGMTSSEFEQIVTDWIKTARHPKYNRPFTDLTYKPMLEMLDFLRANGFNIYIVSGGGVEFMRPWAESVYGVPKENVIGSSIKTKFEMRNDHPVIVRLPELDFIDDGEGKPLGINRVIGKKPIIAFGKSDGDLQMLQWTTSGAGPRLGVIIHHTDSIREVAYDRESKIGHLDVALQKASSNEWTVVSMKDDWKHVFAFE